tara:strand:- start:676 stop:1668 length:993 start_codon:yes stop_codon:yes gene_type:complete
MRGKVWHRFGGVFATVLLFGSCTTAELAVDLAKKYQNNLSLQDSAKVASGENIALPGVVATPRYKVGNPYQIGGIWYYPERNLTYDETGIASWYGDEFAGKLTANGEIFNPSLISAAHKILPMPSIVRVTNLDNGKSLVVRVNDRGPYVSGRIIDMSRAGARLLGFKHKGIARVRVQILAEMSLHYEKLAKAGKFPLLGGEKAPTPPTAAAEKPAVSLTARTTRATAVKPPAGQSAVDLLARVRSGEVLETAPQITELWVQIGAFHSEVNANNVLKKVIDVATGQVSEKEIKGQIFFRSRLGPLSSVKEADNVLFTVFQKGFKGAKIVVD